MQQLTRVAVEDNEAYRVPINGLYEHRVSVVSIDENAAPVRDRNIDDTASADRPAWPPDLRPVRC